MSLNKKTIIYRILVASLSLICCVVLTFSWFNRANRSVTGNALKYEDSVDTNSTDALSMKTYKGTISSTGEITYSDTELSESDKTISGLEPNGKVYFKTVITRNSASTGSKRVTLLLKDSSYAALSSSLKFGTTNPMDTLKSYSSGSDVTLVRNYKVNSTVAVEWYLYLDNSVSTTSGTVKLGYLYLYES